MLHNLRRASILVMVFALSISVSAHAQDFELQQDWSMTSPDPAVQSQGIVFMEPTIYPGSTSYLRSSINSAVEVATYCASTSDPKCAKVDRIEFQAYLSRCIAIDDANCVESVWVSDGENKYEAEFQNYMPERFETSFDAEPSIHLPAGRAPSTWKIKNPGSSNGDINLAVNPIVKGTLMRNVKGDFVIARSDVEVTIDQVQIVTGGYAPPALKNNIPTLAGCLGFSCVGVQVGACAALSSGSCAKRIENRANISFGISLRLSKPPINWIHGRMDKQIFEVEKFPTYMNWKVTGSPMVLPVTSTWIPTTEWVDKLNGKSNGNTSMASWSGPLNAGQWALEQFSSWEPFMDKKAKALQSRWSFRTIGSGTRYNGKLIDDCLVNEEVIGVVTTNAMVYQGDPPLWNQQTETLDYQIAAPHLMPNGEPFLGTYNLKIDELIARCIYGFGASPLRASISIVAPDGTSRVATSTFTKQGKWLVFSVNGFTYSTPQIKIKLSEEKPVVVPTPTPTHTATSKPASAAGAKKTITCVKGKLAKKMTAIKPACPKGYKKA